MKKVKNVSNKKYIKQLNKMNRKIKNKRIKNRKENKKVSRRKKDKINKSKQ